MRVRVINQLLNFYFTKARECAAHEVHFALKGEQPAFALIEKEPQEELHADDDDYWFSRTLRWGCDVYAVLSPIEDSHDAWTLSVRKFTIRDSWHLLVVVAEEPNQSTKTDYRITKEDCSCVYRIIQYSSQCGKGNWQPLAYDGEYVNMKLGTKK